MIHELVIKGYRSIRSEVVTLGDLTFLVGPNGAGKSNLLGALSCLSEAMESPLHVVFDRRGGLSEVRYRGPAQHGPGNLGFCVVAQPRGRDDTTLRYALEVRALSGGGYEVAREQCIVANGGVRHWFDREGVGFRSSATGLAPALSPTSLILPLMGGDRRFEPAFREVADIGVYSIDPSALTQMQEPDSGSRLSPDGGNIASVVAELQDRPGFDNDLMTEYLAALVPQAPRVHSRRHGDKRALEFTQLDTLGGEQTFRPHSMSDGTLRALGILAAVYQSSRPSLLAVEEPEATVHPGALGVILDVLRDASKAMQVVVTTHSPELLDVKWITDSHIRVVTWHDGETRVAPVDQGTRNALSARLMWAGGLFRSNYIEPDEGALLGVRPEPELFEDLG